MSAHFSCSLSTNSFHPKKSLRLYFKQAHIVSATAICNKFFPNKQPLRYPSLPMPFRVVFFSTKPYDKESFDNCLKRWRASGACLEFTYLEDRLTPDTAHLAKGFGML